MLATQLTPDAPVSNSTFTATYDSPLRILEAVKQSESNMGDLEITIPELRAQNGALLEVIKQK
jgi:hypothetical protein